MCLVSAFHLTGFLQSSQCVFSVQFMIVMGMVSSSNLEYGSYEFPDWSTAVGWLITLSSVSVVAAYAIYRYCLEPGSPKQVRSIK